MRAGSLKRWLSTNSQVPGLFPGDLNSWEKGDPFGQSLCETGCPSLSQLNPPTHKMPSRPHVFSTWLPFSPQQGWAGQQMSPGKNKSPSGC